MKLPDRAIKRFAAAILEHMHYSNNALRRFTETGDKRYLGCDANRLEGLRDALTILEIPVEFRKPGGVYVGAVIDGVEYPVDIPKAWEMEIAAWSRGLEAEEESQ